MHEDYAHKKAHPKNKPDKPDVSSASKANAENQVGKTDAQTNTVVTPSKRKPKEKPYFPITHNRIFGLALRRNPQVCKELLETVLNLHLDEIDIVTQEEDIAESALSKSVRLDVSAKAGNKVFDIELQLTRDRDILHRMSYYQSIIDVDNLDKGKPYKDLPETFIIFFCSWDVFSDKQARYELGIARSDTPGFCYDRIHWLIFNFNEWKTCPTKTGKTKELLRYLSTNIPSEDTLVSKLDTIVHTLNHDSRLVSEMVTIAQDIQLQVDNAREEGVSRGEDNLARLYFALEQANRITEYTKALRDPGYRETLYKEFGIS